VERKEKRRIKEFREREREGCVDCSRRKEGGRRKELLPDPTSCSTDFQVKNFGNETA